jgi:nanoRNase/pAp phosphatase (c-di-AMP/oligoRNAs hydrolase)
MEAVDKSDSADLTADEILNPGGWVLLSFIMDARTGLGRYRDYRISNLELMRDMIKYCRNMGVEEILGIPDVSERVDRYFQQQEPYKEMVRNCSRIEKNVLVIDLRNVDEVLSGNRFMEYALFPEQNVSIRCIWGKEKQNIVFTVGHSIVNRTCRTNVGSLMLEYGGGGHRKVGTCQIPAHRADQAFTEIIDRLVSTG